MTFLPPSVNPSVHPTRRQFQHHLGAWAVRATALVAGLGTLSACAEASAASLDDLWRQVRGIAVGPAQPTARLVVFFDTRCGFCTKLWHQLQPMQSQWQVLWVPVAILSPDSRSEAIALLSSTAPQDWRTAHMARASTQPYTAATERADAGAMLDANLQHMLALPDSKRSVPLIVGTRDNTLRTIRGAVPLEHLRNALGLAP